MERSHDVNVSQFFPIHPDRAESILNLLKVIGLAAGYALFVWYAMYQVEHGFSRMLPFSIEPRVEAQSNGSIPVDASAAVDATVGIRPATSQAATQSAFGEPSRQAFDLR